jgi:hypothetical protein
MTQAEYCQAHSLKNHRLTYYNYPCGLADDEVQVPGHSRKRAKPRPLPADIEREIRHYDLTDAEKFCSDPACGCALKPMAIDPCEQLDIVPAKMKVIVHNRKSTRVHLAKVASRSPRCRGRRS